MAAEEVLWMAGVWKVGEIVQITRDGRLVVRGRIKEIIGDGLYKIEVEADGIRFKSS